MSDLTPEQIHSACLSFRHDYGLMTDDQQKQIRFECTEWDHAISKERNESGEIENLRAANLSLVEHMHKQAERIVELEAFCSHIIATDEKPLGMRGASDALYKIADKAKDLLKGTPHEG